MRILRGKSNLEVSSQGFALFVVGLVMATFLGGAIHTVLRSDRLHRRIVRELRTRFPQNQFEIGSTEVLLSQGIWPALGLKLHNVTFKQDVCGKLSFQLQVPTMTLPINLWSLWHRELRLGRVDLQDGKIQLDYRPCSPAVPTKTGEMSSAVSSARPPGKISIAPLKLKWIEAARVMVGANLRNFQVTYRPEPTWKLLFKSAEVSFTREMDMEAEVDVQKSLPFGSLSHVVEFSAHGNDQLLQWNMDTEFKEGRLNWTGNWGLTHNTAVTRVQLIQIPLKDVTSELYQMGLTGRDLKLRTAWLTCTASWEGQLDRADEMPLRLRGCKIEGAYGRVDLAEADYFLNTPTPFKIPAHFHIEKLQVQPVVEALGRQVLPAVIPRLGVWSGDLQVSDSRHWVLDGKLQSLEVVFSNQSLHGKQIIDGLHTEVHREDRQIRARIDQMRMEGGEFTGHVDFVLGEDWRNGDFDVAVDRLGFDSYVQSLLIGGRFDPVKVIGHGHLQAGELHHWTGRISTKSIQGDGWRADQVEVNSQFKDGVVRLEGRAHRALANSNWHLYPRLKVIQPQLASQIEWRDLAADVEVHGSGGSITSLRGLEAGTSLPWLARGTWVRDGDLSASLRVGRGREAHLFSVAGRKGDLIVNDKPPGSAEPHSPF